MVYKYFTTNLQIMLNLHTVHDRKIHTIYILWKAENVSSDRSYSYIWNFLIYTIDFHIIFQYFPVSGGTVYI